MNKYSLQSILASELEGYETSLHTASYDKENNIYLCADRTLNPVYDFDKYVLDKHGSAKTPASPDAIFISKKHLYFIEFKNSAANKIDKEQIQKKFTSGTEILKNLLSRFAGKDSQLTFCVVFQNNPKPRYFNSHHIEQNITRYGLDELNKEQGSFYDEIITQDVKFYVDNFSELDCN